MIIEGAISVKSAVLNRRRQINTVYFDKDKTSKDFKFIIHRLKERQIPYRFVTRSEIDNIATGKTHGGIIADVEARKYQTVQAVNDSLVFVVDGVEDPFNLGYIFRTLRAFGYHQIILPKRDFSFMEANILKSSAGAFDQMDAILSENLSEDLAILKNKYKLVALGRHEGAHNAFAYHYDEPMIIILGGEKRGIQKDVLNLIDAEVFIDYPSDFRNALNAASAISVMAAIIEMRKRGLHD